MGTEYQECCAENCNERATLAIRFQIGDEKLRVDDYYSFACGQEHQRRVISYAREIWGETPLDTSVEPYSSKNFPAILITKGTLQHRLRKTLKPS